MSTVTIHRTDMLGLDLVPVTLIPAAAGIVNMPVRIVVQQNGAFYLSTSHQVDFGWGTIGSPVSVNSAGLLWNAGFTKYLDDVPLFPPLTNNDASQFVNQPFIAFADGPVTELGGTGGDVTFTVWYTALTVH